MPETNAIERIVLRKDPLTEEEWLALISDRVEHMRSIMDRVTLPQLGDIELFNRARGRMLKLSAWRGAPNHEEGILSQQGIFKTELLQTQPARPDPKFVIWGMLRDTTWFAFELSLTFGHEHWVKCYEAQKGHPSFLNKEYGVRYLQMWYLLSRALRDCAKRRREQFRALELLEQQFDREDRLIKPFAR